MTTAQTDRSPGLEIADLQTTDPEPLPFGGGALSIRAFLLERSRGNVLIYSTPGLTAEGRLKDVREGVVRHYLNHGHEAMFLPDDVAVIDAPLVINELDREAAESRSPVPVHGFSMRHFPDPDFEVIPTPGHTPGATAYLWDTGEHRLLFTGDSLFVSEGRWVAAVLGSSDRSSYVESLELLAGLDFDVLVPWAATTGAPALVAVEPGEARTRIEEIIGRVRAGGDG